MSTKHAASLRLPLVVLIVAVVGAAPAIRQLLSRPHTVADGGAVRAADTVPSSDGSFEAIEAIEAIAAIEPGELPAGDSNTDAAVDADIPSEHPARDLDADEDGTVSVALFGDSLADEAKASFVLAFAPHGDRVDVETYTFGGTATCDWLDEIARLSSTGEPDAAVLEFSGNALTPCIQGPDAAPLDRSAYLAKYEADTRAAIDLLRATGTQIYLAIAPVTRDEAADSAAQALRDVYLGLAETDDDVHSIRADEAVLLDGRYQNELPCLDFEDESLGCIGGLIEVRKVSDGAHFCPTDDLAIDGVVGECAVWSSGAFRYGTALAAPIVDAIAA